MSKNEVTMIGEDFYTDIDSLGYLRLRDVDEDQVLIELSPGLKLTVEQLEGIGHAVVKVQRKALEFGRKRGLEEKAAEIRSALGIQLG